jgi:hypothetical protein
LTNKPLQPNPQFAKDTIFTSCLFGVDFSLIWLANNRVSKCLIVWQIPGMISGPHDGHQQRAEMEDGAWYPTINSQPQHAVLQNSITSSTENSVFSGIYVDSHLVGRYVPIHRK